MSAILGVLLIGMVGAICFWKLKSSHSEEEEE